MKLKIKYFLYNNYISLILFALVILILIPLSPYNHPFPSRDSGVFLYIGNLILDGEIPYVDAWDHKGPIIFYINAFALLLKRNSFWGLWIIEILSLATTVILGHKLFRKLFGELPALFGSVLLIFGIPPLIEHGNFVEEYSLPLQVATAFFAYQILENKKYGWRSVLIGAMAAIAFLLRPNNIGIQLALLVILGIQLIRIKDKKKTIQISLTIFSGFALTLGAILLYFYLNGALEELWQAMVKFNVYYSQINTNTTTYVNRFETFIYAIDLSPGLMVMGFSGWGLGLYRLLKPKENDKKFNAILLFLVIWLPTEIFLSLVSGRSYPHYFLTWSPVLASCSAYFIYFFGALLKNNKVTEDKSSLKILVFVLMSSLIFSQTLKQFLPAQKFIQGVIEAKGIPTINQIGDSQINLYLNNSLDEDDYLYMWGNEVSFNVILGIKSPSRYLYLEPLFSLGCEDPKVANEFLNDLIRNKPLIVDTVYYNSNNLGNPYWDCKEMEIVQSYILENYEIIKQIGKWPIYQHK